MRSDSVQTWLSTGFIQANTLKYEGLSKQMLVQIFESWEIPNISMPCVVFVLLDVKPLFLQTFSPTLAASIPEACYNNQNLRFYNGNIQVTCWSIVRHSWTMALLSTDTDDDDTGSSFHHRYNKKYLYKKR